MYAIKLQNVNSFNIFKTEVGLVDNHAEDERLILQVFACNM